MQKHTNYSSLTWEGILIVLRLFLELKFYEEIYFSIDVGENISCSLDFYLKWSSRRKSLFPWCRRKYFLFFKLFLEMKFPEEIFLSLDVGRNISYFLNFSIYWSSSRKWKFTISNPVSSKMDFEIFRSIYDNLWDDHESSWDNNKCGFLWDAWIWMFMYENAH